MRARAALPHGEAGAGLRLVPGMWEDNSARTSSRMVSRYEAQWGEAATSRMALVMVMTEDWMAAKQRDAKRLVIRVGVSSVGSRWERAWEIAHWI